MEKTYNRPEAIDFDTKILKYIIAIVDEKGLSKAAEKMYLSQPALSRYLKGVEQALGTPIFSREHNELCLTNAGKVFVNGARSIIHIEQEALKNIQTGRQDHQTTLLVAVQNLFAPFLKEQVHPLIEEAHPDANLKLTVTSGDHVRSMVSDGTVDLGIFLGSSVESPFFEQRCLFTSELVFCAAADSPSLETTRKNGFRLSNFAHEPMMMSLEDSFLCQTQERLLQENGVNEPEVCARGRLLVLTDLLRLGYGNVILPREAVNLSPEQIFSFSPRQEYSCISAWCKGRPLSSLAQDYLAFAYETLQSFSQAAL